MASLMTRGQSTWQWVKVVVSTMRFGRCSVGKIGRHGSKAGQCRGLSVEESSPSEEGRKTAIQQYCNRNTSVAQVDKPISHTTVSTKFPIREERKT